MNDKVVKVDELKKFMQELVKIYERSYTAVREADMLLDRFYNINEKTPENDKLYAAMKEKLNIIRTTLTPNTENTSSDEKIEIIRKNLSDNEWYKFFNLKNRKSEL